MTLDTAMSEKSEQSLTRDAIRAMRRSYGDIGLESLPADPLAAFSQWLAEAAANEYIVEANAMVLSTLGADDATIAAVHATDRKLFLVQVLGFVAVIALTFALYQ